MSMANGPDNLQQRLGALPEPPLPGDLWPRVARARQRQLANRRMVAGGGVALLVALLVVPFQFRGGLPGQAMDAPTVAAADPVPANEAQPRDFPAADPNAQLRTLDRELQAAYRAGAGSAQIEALWQARADLEDAHPTDLAVRPVRI